jgi:hypothetical protein
MIALRSPKAIKMAAGATGPGSPGVIFAEVGYI